MSLKRAQELAQQLVDELQTIETKVQKRKTPDAPEKPKTKPKAKALKLEPNPECEGNFLNPEDDPCKGGAKADKLVEWQEHKVCQACKLRTKRWQKKHQAE